MLKLHRLEISGFKSFVDPVRTDFSPGITAIVGPNGCGKSNLSEAVTWALGEQSAKFLRSGKMEDVIFSGSQRRRPLGMAEVSLTLLTDPGFEGSDDGHIEIRRRVFRTGESQYRLNGKVVTLKKIKDLLMDTGLGIRAYSVIGQGQVEAVLSGKPQERRKLLEEAAGITRYKARKRLAEIKLEDAVGNLLRLEDVIGELERSLRSLKRQANAARRFKDREVEYKELLAECLNTKWRLLDDELQKRRHDMTKATDAETELSAGLHQNEAALAAEREAADEISQQVAQRHSRLTALAAKIEGRQEFLKGGRRTLDDDAQRLERGTGLSTQYAAELDVQSTALGALGERYSALNSEHDEARSAVATDRERIEGARQRLGACEARVQTRRSELLDVGAKLTSLQSRLHQEQIETEKSTFRGEHTDAELARLSEQQAQAAKGLEGTEQATAEVETNLQAKSTEHEVVVAELEATLRLEAELGEKRQAGKEELTALEQRREILVQLEAEATQRRGDLGRAWSELGLGDARFLADELNVPSGWEDSIDLFLEPLRDAVMVPASEDPRQIATELAKSGTAAVLLYETEEGSPSPAIRPGGTPEPLGSALGLPSELAAALPEAYLVDDIEQAMQLAEKNSHATFLAHGGFWVQGRVIRVQTEGSNPGTLARQRDLTRIGDRLPELSSELEELAARLDSLIGKRTRIAERRNAVEAELVDLRQSQAVLRTRREEARERVDELGRAHEGLEAQRSSISSELGRISEQRKALQAQLTDTQTRTAELETKFDEAQKELNEARELRELLSTAGAGRQGRLDLLEERLEVHSQEKARIEARCRELETQSADWESEKADLEKRGDELEGALATARQELQTALEDQEKDEGAAHLEQEELAAKREQLKSLSLEVDGLRERQEAAREGIQEQRVAEAALKQEVAHIEADYIEEFGNAIADIPVGADTEAEDAPRSLAELEGLLETCKATLDRLGPVNLLAAEDYDEQTQRHEFLTEQRTDVQGSVDRLRGTIREINQTSSERFRKTFAEVNKNFGEVFHNLFRGGEAEMRLLDEDDVLDSGIEIVARPPGKKLQNLMLLSGGEKALTAIALLFALFRTKPSPFCILDEVDAALDDANILRFVELLKASSKDIQFLIISHNKLTMECASTLYGVTMEEKGVSKIVGVELDDMHPAQALATA